MKPKTMMLVGSLAVLFSMFLSWVTASTVMFGLQQSAKGYETDGMFAAALGFITLVIALVKKETPGQKYQVVAGILGILIMLVCAFVALNIVGAGSENVNVSLDVGPLVCFIGGLLITKSGFSTIPGQPESTIKVTEYPEDPEEADENQE